MATEQVAVRFSQFYYYIFYWLFGSGRNFKVKSRKKNMGRTFNNRSRKTSSECPCFVRPYEACYFVILDVFSLT